MVRIGCRNMVGRLSMVVVVVVHRWRDMEGSWRNSVTRSRSMEGKLTM